MFIIQAFELTVNVNILYKLIPDSYEASLKDKYNGVQKIVQGIAAFIGMGSLGFIFDLLGTIIASRIIVVVYFFLCWIFIVALQI